MRQRRQLLLRRQCNTTLSFSYCLSLWETASGGQFDWGVTPLTKETGSDANAAIPLKSEVPKDLLIKVRNLEKSVRAKGGLIGRLTTRRPNAKAWSSDLPCLINSVDGLCQLEQAIFRKNGGRTCQKSYHGDNGVVARESPYCISRKLFSGRFFEPAHKALAVKKYYIGKYRVKSTAFVASPPSARLFLGVQQRPRVGVFTHQRVTLAGLSTVRASTVFIY